MDTVVFMSLIVIAGATGTAIGAFVMLALRPKA